MMPNAGMETEAESWAVEEELSLTSDLTVDRWTPNGYLSLDAAVTVEQFGRLNGLTGRKMQKIFKSLAPNTLKSDARSLVEYCCFQYLSQDGSDFHPDLKDLSFQRLIFITMLAWEHPYSQDGEQYISDEKYSLQGRHVGEEAFVRIASAVAGVADISTAHHLFKALAGDQHGMSLKSWILYISELTKICQRRETYKAGDVLSSDERILCIGAGRKRPVLKWEDSIVWPGNLTLTDKALYFEAIGLKNMKKPLRLDITGHGTRVTKVKVGPFRSKLFDSAISVTSGSSSEEWVLEFVDFGSGMRRDVWLAFISEIISLYDFLREYEPMDDDRTMPHVYQHRKGNQRAVESAANSIARLQSLQFIGRMCEDPAKLVQFSYLQTVPYGDVVLQSLAVDFWGSQLVSNVKPASYQPLLWAQAAEDPPFSNLHMYNVDGSVYLRRWMRSPTWASNDSNAFWKSSFIRNSAIVLSKSLVVADENHVQRAARTCKERSRVIEKTQATIIAATIEGIPSNIDLFKELVLPIVVISKKFEQLRRWEEPRRTIGFLVIVYTLIFRNVLAYIFPLTLTMLGATMLLMKELSEQGRLGRSFCKVTIRDQPPSNTIQKIIALKEAMAYMESSLQNLNVSLLKMRTIFLAGQPEITSQVAFLLLGSAAILLLVPFKFIISFFILDLFTRELEFRRETVAKFRKFLRERWASVHASPVVVLPYEDRTAPAENASRDDDGPNSQPSNLRTGAAVIKNYND